MRFFSHKNHCLEAFCFLTFEFLLCNGHCCDRNKVSNMSSRFSAELESKREGEAPRFTAPLKNRIIEDGSAARFDVRVRGRPAPQVTWFKDDEEITGHKFSHIKVFQEDNLFSILITEGKIKDAGQYKVVAKNVLGDASSTASLIVEGVFEHVLFKVQCT